MDLGITATRGYITCILFKILVEKFEHFELTFFKQHVRQLLYPCVCDGRDHALLNQVLIAYPQLH